MKPRRSRILRRVAQRADIRRREAIARQLMFNANRRALEGEIKRIQREGFV